MNRIDVTIKQLQQQNKKILSPYITAGDPTPEMTVPLMHSLVASGADILEIGIPFSDPMGEGKVIQAAIERALQFEVNCEAIFSMVRLFREKNNHTPLILMGYLNPIVQFGYEPFAKMASHSGVDGTLIIDLPPEESAMIAPIWAQYNLNPIYLCSPTTSPERMVLINRYAKSYLYYVSLKGTTGSANLDVVEVRKQYQLRKSQTTLPIVVGFGIKTPVQAGALARFVDGIVIGAALIEQIYNAYIGDGDPIQEAGYFINQLRCRIDKIEEI